MKAINRILKTIKIPFKFVYKIRSSPIKFVCNKQKELIKIISPSLRLLQLKYIELVEKLLLLSYL